MKEEKMIIVFVVDNFEHLTNGTTISARRFREELEKRGHTVRVVSDIDNTDGQARGEWLYALKVRNIPIVSKIASWNNMRFAQFDEATIRRALAGADVVHLFFPWELQKRCLAIARGMGIAVTAAFHCQSENITYNIKMKYFGFLNSFIYWFFHIKLYRDVGHIHCPSAFAAGELKKHHYKAVLHVFSNGVQDRFRPPAGEGADPYLQCEPDAKIHILMTGRLSEEKRQDVLIKAVQHSRHSARIQLHFAGKGPRERYYRRLSAGLPLLPEFRFVSQEELVGLIHRSYIYVHASEVEIEGLGCLEALACGLVPVIANSEKSAAPQFALDERSLFRTGDWRDLRDKIDYWIDNPDERRRMRLEYARLGEKYRVSSSARLMEEMFLQAIAESHA